MRVVLDTNVLLSGLMAPKGVPGRIVAAWIDAQFELVMSVGQVDEVARVMAYPKIRRRLRWDEERIESFIKQLHVRAEVIDLGSTAAEVPRDPKDSPVLAPLVAAKADLLVTGDDDLLALRSRYAIETPTEFGSRL
jgi:putative PIN family toxin of toxin-antitoxin system